MRKNFFREASTIVLAMRSAFILVLFGTILVAGVNYFNGSVLVIYLGLFVAVAVEYLVYRVQSYTRGNARNLKM